MPTLRLTDKAFQYTPAAQTDLKARFEQIRREQKHSSNVTPIRKEQR